MSQLNQSWRALVRPEQVRDAALTLKRPEFIDWMAGVFSVVEQQARLAERLKLSEGVRLDGSVIMTEHQFAELLNSR